jgi:hypothetical protein
VAATRRQPTGRPKWSRPRLRARRVREQRVQSRAVEEPPGRDDRPDATRVADVGERVGVEQHEVGEHPDRHGARLAL